MNRILTFALAIAVVGGLAVLTTAGTVAADDVTQTIETGDATNIVDGEQTNINEQVGEATSGDAFAVNDGLNGVAGVTALADDDDPATSIAIVEQEQTVEQINEATIEQDADTSVDATVDADNVTENND